MKIKSISFKKKTFSSFINYFEDNKKQRITNFLRVQ